MEDAELEKDIACLEEYDYFFRPDLLSGKVAFITGGGSGIGFTIAEVLMRHKCSTVIFGRKFERLSTAARKLENLTGQKCLPLKGDVRKVDEVEAAVDKAIEHFSRIDVLVNGAAGNFVCPASKLSYNGIKTVIDIDTLGTFNVSKAVYNKCFKNNGGGSIINITATLHYNGQPFQCHAGSAKAAIEAMMRHLAVEWGPDGVRVNCVAPGPVADTEGFQRLGKHAGPNFVKKFPIQRLGTRRDIADATVFLASGASSFITSNTLVVDGGSWMTGSGSMATIKAHSKL
ncbi:peroxisomal 2,4-dienoyl-CoA reductase [(3E)-enoyl-CoA-producing]-like [Montipora capricornis]|uniref:peroxisomal 2,4-dienoyl-CoA reductase [(3E)-enoyl-CoA-producing]-like n=1 Tax=Montipora capricornis TaxID=246305 RepID=UPI0035F1241A